VILLPILLQNCFQFQLAPLQIGNLTALQVLVLGSNELTGVPAELGGLTAMTRLDLRFNPIVGALPYGVAAGAYTRPLLRST